MRVIIYLLGFLLCSLPISATAQKKDVLLLMSSFNAKAKVELLKTLSEDQPFTLELFTTTGKSDTDIAERWGKADLILLDGINPALSQAMFGQYQPLLAQFPHVPVIALGEPDNKDMNQGISATDQANITAYFSNAGRKNYRNLMQYISSHIFSLSSGKVDAPQIMPRVGLYHPDFPDTVTDNSNTFFSWLTAQPEQPVIGVAIHRSAIDYEQQQVIDSLIHSLQQKGAQAFAFFFDDEDKELSYLELLKNGSQPRAHLLINYRSLHYVERRRQEFEALGIPVIHALNYNDGDEHAFIKDNAGISPNQTPFFLIMPEDTGSIDPVIIAATENGKSVPIKAQMDALAERAYNHARLALVPNSKKKIATFIWNYPPGEKNIGAAFLDVPSSIEQIANALQQDGYTISPKEAKTLIDEAGQLLRPYYRGENTASLIDKGLADYMPLQTYLDWFNALPESVTAPIISRWGKPEDNNMLTMHNGQPHFVIPRMTLGNLIVLPQGLRGDTAQEHSDLYHNTQTAINHSYLAVYLYTRNTFGADAIIHLGTHGSQEWLSGKERGLSVYDAPNLVIGNIPVFYPYIIDNVGEAMQAKRRGRATIISHLTPGFAKAGLYADVARLAELISTYTMLDDGQTRTNTRNSIIELAQTLNILQDLQLSKQQLTEQFEQHIEAIHNHLNELAKQSQPLGVHTFGLLPKEAHLYSTILQILGEEFTHSAAQYEKQHGMSIPLNEQTDQNGVIKLEALEGFQLLQAFINNQPLKKLPDSLHKSLTEAREHWDNFHQIAETQALVQGLNGKYIRTSFGGDPIRNPQAAPTGRNLIGFNPAKVPSPEAYQAGVALMEQTIADYVSKHGRYPEKLAFSLWSLETMRHQGALEAQILHAMGVKPVWNNQGQVTGTEIIPYSELKRPRIDVVITATGLYRDAFPNVMLWLAEAIDTIARQQEENNYLYQHRLSLKQQLVAEGSSEEDADYLSSVRIFSNQSGSYGTGLASATLDSGSWETDAAMAEQYLQRMSFAYGKDEKRWSEPVSNTGLYNKTLSGTDGVIFSRSTNLYALMTNDDPFQYFGGLGQAVRHLDGKTPEMYVSNLRRSDDIKAQTLQEFINQEMRSRYFHPRWIEAMQEAGYAGALTMLDRMNNMWGWEVMTPDAIRDDHWQEFFDVYIEDKYNLQLKAFFEQHNTDALAQILERMLEAVRKGYWPADEETLRKMLETYTEIANKYDVFTDNEKFRDYVNQQAAGFGLAPLAAAMTTPAAAANMAQQVSGQKLEQVQQSDYEPDYTLWYLMLLIFTAGLVSPLLQRKPKTL